MEDKIPASDSDDNVGDIAPREKPKTPAKQLDDDLREAVGDDAKDDSDDEEEEECVYGCKLCGAELTFAH